MKITPQLQWKIDRNGEATRQLRRYKAKLRKTYADVGDGWEHVPKKLDLACCDCSLVHSIEFRVKLVKERHGKRKG